MSKGNLFMGYARGKVGSVVMARSKGQQVARAHNDAPKNPRSLRQMMQRSIFSSAVKFFTQGRQAFFKFAFENKSMKESDYNAFMRENALRGQHISQAAYNEATYPVLSPFMMTKGSIAELALDVNSAGTAFQLGLDGVTTTSTWGNVCTQLKALYGLENGDIITLCVVTANGSTSTNTPAVTPEKRERIDWSIKQEIIDTESTTALNAVLGGIVSSIADNVVITPAKMGTAPVGACITVSRVTTAGTKVSDSYLALNTTANTIYENASEDAYINEVLKSWKATGEAILQGSLVQ